MPTPRKPSGPRSSKPKNGLSTEQQAELIIKATQTIGSAQSLDEMLATLSRVLEFDFIDILVLLRIYGDNYEGVEVLSVWDRAKELAMPAGTRLPREKNPSLQSVSMDEPTIFNDYRSDERVDEDSRAIMVDQMNILSAATFPLRVGNTTIGIFGVDSREQHTFTPGEIEIFNNLAQVLAVVVKGIESQNKLMRQVERMHLLYRVSERLMQYNDEDTLIKQATHMLVEETGYRNSWIALVDRDAGKLVGHSGAGVLLTPELIAMEYTLDTPVTVVDVANNGQMIAYNSRERAKAEGWEELAINADLYTTINVPLRTAEAVIGILAVGSSAPTAEESELSLLAAFANQLAVSLQRIRLTQKQAEQLQALSASYAQQEQLLNTVRELSTPTIPIYNGVLIMPLVGHLDTNRSSQVTESLLYAIQQQDADVAILDITGVPIIDTSVANHLIQATKAANLLGTTCMIVGITPEVAQTITQLGVDMQGLITRRNLQAGIMEAFRHRGLRIVRVRERYEEVEE